MKMIVSFSLLFSFSLFIGAAFGHDITQMLNQFGDFGNFNSYLTQTNLATEINNRKTITVLVVDNGAISSLSQYPPATIKNILSVHVVLDYYDVAKLNHLSGSTLLTTLFQSTGMAKGQQGFLQVTHPSADSTALGSAMPGSPQGSGIVKNVTAEPYDISIIQISNPIIPQGIDGSKISAPPTMAAPTTPPPPPTTTATPPPPPTTATTPPPPTTATTPPPPSTNTTTPPPPTTTAAPSLAPTTTATPPPPTTTATPPPPSTNTNTTTPPPPTTNTTTPPPPPATTTAPTSNPTLAPSSLSPPTASSIPSSSPKASSGPPTASSSPSSSPTAAEGPANSVGASPSGAPGSAPDSGSAVDVPATEESTPATEELAGGAPAGKSAGTTVEAGLAVVCAAALSSLYMTSRI